MPLGREVGLVPHDIALDKDPAPPRKGGTSAPLLGPCLLWSNGWMDQDATLYGGRLQPRLHRVRWGPSFPPERDTAARTSRSMSVVAKLLNGSRCHLVRR